MIRILHVLNSMHSGGIESFLMNVYRKLDKNKFQFDFLLFQKTNSQYEKEIISLGGQLYYLPSRRKGWIKNIHELTQFFKGDNHRIIHMHVSCLSYITPLIIAKRYKVPVRIVHAHSSVAPGNKLHYFLHHFNKLRISSICTHFFSCSDIAGSWLFSGTEAENKVIYIPNGIECDKFKFSSSIRDKYRTELGIENKMVLIHIGRLSKEKNHEFLIRIFKDYNSINKNSALLIVGSGDEKENISSFIKKNNLESSIYLLGQRSDISQLLQASDINLLPSFYEGFPVSLVEAQATGIPCLFSDRITNMAKIIPNTKMLSIDNGTSIWIEAITNIQQNSPREEASDLVESKGFGIISVTKNLEQIYMKSVESYYEK